MPGGVAIVTDATNAEAGLREWAIYMLPHGVIQAQMALDVLVELELSRKLVERLCERIAASSEVLTAVAERKRS